MARGMPQSKSENDIAPLTVRRLTNVPLARIGIFKSLSEKEDKRSGEKYEVEQIKLSLDWDSGYVMSNEDGEPILDREGREQTHYINDGFVTLSGHAKSKLVPILRALGFDGPRFIVQDGKDAGGLTAEAAESIELVFGTNGLGKDYAGAEWEDLPFYTTRAEGGTHGKREVEVPVLSFKILGEEVLGRHIDMQLEIKNGYNKPAAYLMSEDTEVIGSKPKPRKASPARGVPASKEAPKAGDADDPFTPEQSKPWESTLYDFSGDDPESRARRYAQTTLVEAKVPQSFHAAVVRAMTGSGPEDFLSLEDMPLDVGRTFRDMVKTYPEGIQEALEMVQSGGSDGADEEPVEEEEEEDF